MEKRTKKVSINQKHKFLKLYLLSKNYTIKDLKVEVILMICDMLIDNYITSDEKQNNKLVIESFTTQETNIIMKTLKELQKDIRENTISITSIQNVIDNHFTCEKSLIKAKLVEPVSYFYNVGVNSLKSKILSQNEEKENIQWIPDLIAIYLILDMEIEGYQFNKFTFIKKYNLEYLVSIYQKTNKVLKRKEGISFLSKNYSEKTIISKMQNVSFSVVNTLIKSKYK